LCYSKRVRFVTSLLLIGLVSCSSGGDGGGGDPHSNNGIPPVGGKDKRIRDIADPGVDGHADIVSTTQAVSGAIVIAVDSFDETQNGKSIGTIYVQDLGSKEPYSGITLFAPTFNPGNLAVSPGDVLDMRGKYTEAKTIGTTVTFAPDSVLPQISQPVATFRYETQVPEPLDIDAADLTDFKKGRRWMGMLVRVKNVTLQRDASADPASGRVTVDLSEGVAGAAKGCDAAFPKPASLTNDLFDVASMNLTKGTVLKSVVGVVGFFCNLKLAPRSKADIVL
jgi:hypothetical protein